MNYRVPALCSLKGLVLAIPEDLPTANLSVYPVVKGQMTVNPNVSYPERFAFGVLVTGNINYYVWIE